MGKITVLGSYNQDLTMIIDRFPKPKETLKNGDFFMSPGGKGSNQAHAAAQLGGNVTLIAKVGDDAFGIVAKDHFRKSGIKTDYILTDPDAPTGSAMILVERKSGENSIVVSSGANHSFLESDITKLEPILQSSDIAVFQFENPLPIVEYAIKVAKKGKTLVCLNPAPMITPFPLHLLPLIDILVLNEVEAEDLVKYPIHEIDDAKKTAQELLNMGVRLAIITLGSKGVVAVSKDVCLFQPAFDVKVVDTTGAGDAFVGGFAVAYSETHDLNHSLQFASAAAALNVTKKGATPANPTRQEVLYFLENY
ncbi:MAG: ribokinase [Promethearchaeota archaeon]